VGVTRHLGYIEETILESVGWQEGSPVFALLADPAKVRDLLALFKRPAQVRHNNNNNYNNNNKYLNFFIFRGAAKSS
jgi:hypothetical protein